MLLNVSRRSTSSVCSLCRGARPAVPRAVSRAVAAGSTNVFRTTPSLSSLPTTLRSLHTSRTPYKPTTVQPSGAPEPQAPDVSLDPGRVVDTALVSRPDTPAEPEVLQGEPAHISLTARAADRLRQATETDSAEGALRLAVEPGGCHGYQYKIALDLEADEDDFVFEAGPQARVRVDSTSLQLIKGSTVDYVTELIGSQFVIRDNPQAKGAGCGCGVSWEPK